MSRLRIAALLSASSVGLHELRWALAPAAGEPSHGYVPYAGALAGLAVAFAVSELLARAADARRSGRGEDRLAFRRAWPMAAAALLAIFTAQELLEGAALASGFWLGLPLAIVFGALVALGLIGAAAIVAAAARAFRRPAPRAPLVRRPRARFAAPVSVISAHLAGRAPPSTA